MLHTWVYKAEPVRQGAEATLNKQFHTHCADLMLARRDFGARKDIGVVLVAVKCFF